MLGGVPLDGAWQEHQIEELRLALQSWREANPSP